MAAMYQHYLSLWFKWGLYVSCKMKFCLLFTCTINTIFSICMNVFALQCIGSHAMLQFSRFLQSIFYVGSSNFCRPCTRASIFLAAWTRGGVIRCESRWQFYLEHGHNSGNSHIFALLFFLNLTYRYFDNAACWQLTINAFPISKPCTVFLYS